MPAAAQGHEMHCASAAHARGLVARIGEGMTNKSDRFLYPISFPSISEPGMYLVLQSFIYLSN